MLQKRCKGCQMVQKGYKRLLKQATSCQKATKPPNVTKFCQKLARVVKSWQKSLKTLKTLKSTDKGWVPFGRRTTRVQVKTGKMKTGGEHWEKLKRLANIGEQLQTLALNWDKTYHIISQMHLYTSIHLQMYHMTYTSIHLQMYHMTLG